MKETEIEAWDSHLYKEKCDKCDKEHELKTQKDNYPEYYTDVYLKCDCGDFVLFSLPVN